MINLKNSKKFLFGLILCAIFATCQNKDIVDINSDINNIVQTTLYEDLPVGCDSVQIVLPSNSIFNSFSYLEGDLAASIFYYENEKTVAVLSNGTYASARLIRNDGSISDELVLQQMSLRSEEGLISYVFTVNGEEILTINSNGDTEMGGYLGCVDDISEQMCDGSQGSASRVLCKICGGCAVVAAALICLF